MESNIKVVELKGKIPGRTAVILGGVHGNEVCGVKAFDEILPSLQIDAGKVIFIYSNLEAIKQNKRFIEVNLNRCFLEDQPEDIKKSLEGRTAVEIMRHMDAAEVSLDIHASYTKDSIPFAITDEKNIEDCKIFDVDIASFNFDPFHPGSSEYYMNLKGKKGFCVECGYLGDPHSMEIAKSAIFNFLNSTGNIYGKSNKKEKQKILMVEGMYRNKNGPFKTSRYFKDFEVLKEKTLIGIDGTEEIYGEEGSVMLFVRDRENAGDECFMYAKYLN